MDPSGLEPPWVPDPYVNDELPLVRESGETLGGDQTTAPDRRFIDYFLEHGSLDGVPIVRTTKPSVEITKIIVRKTGMSQYRYLRAHSASFGPLVFSDKQPLGFIDQSTARGYGFEVEVYYSGDKDKLRIEQWVCGDESSEWGSAVRPAEDIGDKGGIEVGSASVFMGSGSVNTRTKDDDPRSEQSDLLL